MSTPPSPAAAPVGTPVQAPAVWQPRRVRRSLDAAYVGGVAAGLARHLALPVLWVRGFFVVSTLVGGFGAVTYAALWLLVPAERHFDDATPGLAAASRQGRRTTSAPGVLRDLGPLVAVGAVTAGLVLLVGAVTGARTLWPLVLAAVAVAVLWRQADEAQRARWRDSGLRVGPLRVVVGGGGWASYARILAGLVLLVGAIVLLLVRGGGLGVARDAAFAALLGVGGVVLMVGPWLFRLSSDLTEERTERIRSQERADVAAHLHDSVLQTLALIQRSSDDPDQVTRLARAQERDLRGWLFEPEPTSGDSLVAALRRQAAEVEDAHGLQVDVVCVGDAALSQPLVLAAREAMVNAAKHSGAPQVDVYAEAGSSGVEVFVRDRGAGFDLDRIPGDRHGVRHSIVDRMARHGGAARVRSAPGEGTEVRLSLPSPLAPRQDA